MPQLQFGMHLYFFANLDAQKGSLKFRIKNFVLLVRQCFVLGMSDVFSYAQDGTLF